MLAHNWYLGFTCFGGPTVHFQVFRELFVGRYQWIDETTYQEMFALCQALMGPASTKMLFGINVLRYGFWVGLLAFFVWSLPMAIAAAGLAFGVAKIGDKLPDPVYALLSGLNSATVGIIALAAVKLSQKAITDKLTRILVFLGGAAGMLYNALWFFPVLMVAGGFTTVVWDSKLPQRIWRSVLRSNTRAAASRPSGAERPAVSSSIEPLHGGSTAVSYSVQTRPEGEVRQFSTRASNCRLTSSWKVASGIIAAFFSIFAIVMVCRGVFGGRYLPFDLFANLLLAGTIIFGGGPVVVPLLREYIVSPGWVSSRDFLIGLAITQSFPGPNFNIAVYLAILALRNSSIPPIVGAFIGFFAIYLPGIWLYVGFMGLWSTMRRLPIVRSCLRGMHATAVGLVFTAVYRLFKIGYLDANAQQGSSLDVDPWWIVIIATAFIGGMHFGLAPPFAILLGGAMGMIWYGVVGA
jgi:chromate transport protein ChrA